MILGAAVSVAAWLHVPPLCTLLLKAGGAEWMVLRLGSIMDVLFALFVPGAVAAVVAKVLAQNSAPRVFPTLVFRWSFSMCCLFLGAFFASHNGPYTWKSYLQRGEYDKGVRYGTQLNPLRRLSDDLEAVVPADAVVLADPSIGMKVVMTHDCRVVTSTSSSVGVRGMGARYTAVREMLAGKTEEEHRSSLLDQYDVTYLVAQRPAPNWTFERMASFTPPNLVGASSAFEVSMNQNAGLKVNTSRPCSMPAGMRKPSSSSRRRSKGIPRISN